MSLDEADRILEEEHPGPSEAESVLFQSRIKDVLSNHGLVLDEQTPLEEVVRLMRERNQRCALLTENGKLAGIFTERDVLMKLIGTRVDLARTPVRPYMTRELVTLPAEAGIAYALNEMSMGGFSHIPVVDADGKPAGVVSMRDIIDHLTEFFHKDVLNLPPDPMRSFLHREGA